jgi:hypothetical protein
MVGERSWRQGRESDVASLTPFRSGWAQDKGKRRKLCAVLTLPAIYEHSLVRVPLQCWKTTVCTER